ncbi:chaperone protein dnaJ 72 isoform X1 [Oryza brachyantha]|uniref:chaperone protein dnaJ 72 isoform X1 n=1 Tax=Oryza brachyantha TaxID=4533 RepID=UPI001ADA68FE|nr:chaperone protein dnaJ 72 isoform X1 [Oryza brachyantha]
MGGDHYQTLGLQRDATKAEVKAAFRRRALRDHPDRHAHSHDAAARADAARRFRLASDAYRVLSDDRLRAEYDLRLRPSSWSSSSASYGYGYGYGHSRRGRSWRRDPPGGGGAAASARFDWDLLLKSVTRRGFLINLGFARLSITKIKLEWLLLVPARLYIDFEQGDRKNKMPCIGLNLSCWSVLLTGAAFLDGSILEIWKMNNSGKSFEDAMESIEKVKIQKENR